MKRVLAMLAILMMTGIISADGGFYTSISGDGDISQTFTVSVGPVNAKDAINLHGSGLKVEAGLDVGDSGAHYWKSARAMGSTIKDKTTVVALAKTWFIDKTTMKGTKLHFDKSVSVGPSGIYYHTNAYTGNRNVYGYNTLDRYTYIKNHFDGDFGYRDMSFKAKATGSYEPDKYKLETNVGVDFSNSKLMFSDNGFTRGDYARFDNKIYTYIDGTGGTLVQSGVANPGRIDYSFGFSVDL